MDGKKAQAAYNQDLVRISYEQVKASDFCDALETFDPTTIQQALACQEWPTAAVYVMTELIQRLTLDSVTDENARVKFNDLTACMFKLGKVALRLNESHLEQH